MNGLTPPSVIKISTALLLTVLIALVVYLKPKATKPTYSDFILLENEIEDFQSITKSEIIDLGLYRGTYVREGLESSHQLNFFSEERYNSKIEPDIYNCDKTSCDPLSLLKDDIYQSYICGHIKSLPFSFFDDPPYISNNGYSFVFRAFHSSGKEFGSKEWLKTNRQYLSLPEITLSQSIRSALGLDKLNLDSELISKLSGGDKAFAHKEKIYIRTQLGSLKYKSYRLASLKKYLESKALYSLTKETHKSCILKGSGFCFQRITPPEVSSAQSLYYILIATLVAFSIFLMVINFLKIRRDSKQSSLRKLALDNLTHDFRTPVTNMVMMSKDLDHIFQNSPHNDQVKWLSFSSQVHKLHRATEDTKHYIQLLSSNKISRTQIPSIKSWLTSICAENISLNLSEKDFNVETNPYWLHVCIRNLIKNAKDHGGEKIELQIKEHKLSLEIIVTDSGPGLQRPLSELTNEFSKGSLSSGLGLGLSIVAKAAELMGSELKYSQDPTAFSLKLKKGTQVYAADSHC